MEIEVTVDSKEVEKTLKVFPMRVRRAVADGLDHAARSFMKSFRDEMGVKKQSRPGIISRFRSITTVDGKTVFLRHSKKEGAAVNAIANSSDDVNQMQIEIYTKSKVAGLHERGGYARGSGMMAIPLNEEARAMRRNKVPLTTLIPIVRPGKAILLGRKEGWGGKKIRPLFILKRSVYLRPRLGFYSTWQRHSGRREEILDQAVKDAVDKI